MSFSVRFGAVALLVVAGLFLAGCGDTVIDEKKTEDSIQQSVEKSIDEKVTSVDCPSDQKVEAGETFTCEIALKNGQKATTTLKILDDEATVKVISLKPVSGQ